ncbi:hypothetical protein IAR55_005523 [Kwoniella newhampshirensis]|uniref:NADP-dependent oxidoreductase domain-containing protein n=1 Tax=Kwoniella newhampshirensis TaxID=1651941 RepID=A0AAW0YWH9_9TREE
MTITVAGKQVGRIGYGLMQLTWNAAPAPYEDLFPAMKAAADAGATCWSSATFYGANNANVRLIRAFFDKHPEYKDKIVLTIKGWVNTATAVPVNDLDFLRKDVQEVKDILGDKEIDVYLPARLDLASSTVESVFGKFAILQQEGLFRSIGVSEVTAETLEKISKVVSLAMIENEVSLFTQDQATRKVIEWSTKNKVPILAYSPLGRGFLAGRFKKQEDIPANSLLRVYPWFQGEAFENNAKLAEKLEEIGKKKGVRSSQLALAWLTQLSDQILPIPGSSNPERIVSNSKAADIKLTPEELEEINKWADANKTLGDRYADMFKPYLMQ